MRVVLAIDGTKFSEAAAQMVLQQFRPENTEVAVLHVVEPLLLAPEFREGNIGSIRAAERRLSEEGKAMVARAEEGMHRAGFKVQATVEEGDHRAMIIDYASRWNADLIVLGSHGRRGLNRFLMGSVAEFVARHARCSVMIVRPSPSVPLKPT